MLCCFCLCELFLETAHHFFTPGSSQVLWRNCRSQPVRLFGISFRLKIFWFLGYFFRCVISSEKSFGIPMLSLFFRKKMKLGCNSSNFVFFSWVRYLRIKYRIGQWIGWIDVWDFLSLMLTVTCWNLLLG